MSFPITKIDTGRSHSTSLVGVIRQLEDVADELAIDGFDEDSTSLRTTIDDLRWQYEELIDKELAAQWPNGPRRPLRTVRRAF